MRWWLSLLRGAGCTDGHWWLSLLRSSRMHWGAVGCTDGNLEYWTLHWHCEEARFDSIFSLGAFRSHQHDASDVSHIAHTLTQQVRQTSTYWLSLRSRIVLVKCMSTTLSHSETTWPRLMTSLRATRSFWQDACRRTRCMTQFHTTSLGKTDSYLFCKLLDGIDSVPV